MMKKYLLSITLLLITVFCMGQAKVYVSTVGDDANEGTLGKPVRTLEAALAKAFTYSGKDVVIELLGGIYNLEKTLEVRAVDFSLRSLHIHPHLHENVTITGSEKLQLNWQPYSGRIIKAYLDLKESPDQLFLNGRSLPMARYPNYDSTARVFNGTAPDAISNAKVSSWKNPAGGYIHALHEGEWGGFHYRITGKDVTGKLTYEGGWQNNRPAPMHKEYRFVENIFEELDAPGEWFYDQSSKTIFLYPPAGADVIKATITISRLTDLIHISGTATNPVKNVFINNIAFTQTERSFMLVKEPLLRSDWTIYRGGAILLDGTEQVNINNCRFYELGGNAVFLSNYNNEDTVSDNDIHDIGGNAIAFVGDPRSVRSPAFQYDSFVPWNKMDDTAGPRGKNYPQYCLASGNLVHHIGATEKQVAGVEIAMSDHIKISHNTIYNVPRSGINIGDGCWGGHILEYNDVFNTVLETGDHGAFNSWGRDRYWRPDRSIIDSIVAAKPGIELLDAISPVIIRNNRFQCDHGWDIDLDDGSSNYLIYNNVCLNGGLKLREGYHRIVTNNILINNTFHPHVWLKNSGDIFVHNIVTTAYAPILMSDWGKEIDSNFFLSAEGLEKSQQLSLDKKSEGGDAQFINSRAGDYRVKPGSRALKTGFKNFEMNFGVTLPALKRIAAQPVLKPLFTNSTGSREQQVEWLGAHFKNITSLGERSAAGMHDNNGAMLVSLPVKSAAAKNHLQKGDVIIMMGDAAIKSVNQLVQTYQSIKWMGTTECIVIRNQSQQRIIISFK